MPFSSRFALRLAFFSFLCLLVFAMSSPRLPQALAARATQQQQKHPGGKMETTRADNKASAWQSQKSSSKGARGVARAVVADGDVQPATVCAQNQPIAFGQTINGTLANGDCVNPVDNDNSLVDEYTFNGTAGQQISVSMSSTGFDTFLYLLRPDGTVLDSNDDIDTNNTNSRIPPTGLITLPTSGVYSILANSFAPESRGAYSVTLTSGATCSLTPIAFGETKAGSLSASDCTNPIDGDGTFADLYTFNGTAGQQISITMTATSPGNVNPYLYLVLPNGELLAEDNDGGGGTTARIPQGTGVGRLPMSGTYTIVANTASTSQSGNYNLTLARGADCASTPIALNGTANGTLATSDCRLLEDSSFLDAYTFSGTAGQQIVITMTSSTTGLVPVVFLLSPTGTVLAIDANPNSSNTARIPAGTASFTLPSNGTYTILANSFAPGQTGNYSLKLVDPATQACAVTLYPTINPFINGGGNGRFTVITTSSCAWTATSNASWITLTSGFTSGTGTGRVRYTVAQNPTGATRTGTITVNGQIHTVTQTSTSTTPTIQFNGAVINGNATYTTNENEPANTSAKSATITVTRTGDTAGATTVEYATVDNPAAIPCNPENTAERGIAYARCDYSTTVDTLTFAVGETSKSFTVPINNDVHVEGNETFDIRLSNPQGATLGTATTARVTITDNDFVASATNPINQTPFFVRQQYLDFLTREPEAGEPWSAVLNNCSNVNDNPACDRITVSGAFFGSPEFRLKGFFVFLYYKATFGTANTPLYVPEYDQFVPDTRRVSGLTSEEVIAKRLDFSEDWVTRPDVLAVFPNTLTNEAFVDKALGNLGITLTNADPATNETRNSLVAALNAGTKTRAQVLRIIVESTEAVAAHFNRAFVAIQYYGYLRRTPEAPGYQNNLNVLNATNNSRQLINGFLNSIEYRWRFGPNTVQ